MTVKHILLVKSPRADKKWSVQLSDGNKIVKTVHFGQEGYSDYTKHKDFDRMQRYLTRHRKRENWKKSGIDTAGFWSRWLIWNKPTLQASIKDIEKRFNVKITQSKRKFNSMMSK